MKVGGDGPALSLACGASYSVRSRYHGRGGVLFAWGGPDNKHFASSGTSKVVHVFRRDVAGFNLVDQIMPPGSKVCSGLAWTADGEILAVAQENSSLLVLWFASTKKYKTYDVGIRDLTMIKWCRVSSHLAVGTSRGSVCIVDAFSWSHVTVERRKRSRVRDGAWSSTTNRFAFQCEDAGDVLIVNTEGRVLQRICVKGAVLSMAYNSFMPRCRKRQGAGRGSSAGGNGAKKKMDGLVCDDDEMDEEDGLEGILLPGGASDVAVVSLSHCARNEAVSLNVNGKYILFYRISDGHQMELSFEPRYGDIVAHHWMSEKVFLVGFSGGNIVMVNVQHHDRELFCLEVPRAGLAGESFGGAPTNRSGLVGGTTGSAGGSSAGIHGHDGSGNNNPAGHSNAAFHYSKQSKVACFRDKATVTFIDLSGHQRSRPELVQVSFMGSEEDHIVLSPDGAMLTITGVHGNLWHYVTSHFLRAKEKPAAFSVRAAKTFLVEQFVQPVSSEVLILSTFCGILLFSLFGANLLGTSTTNFWYSLLGMAHTL
jgi:hypothetical protein